MKKQHIYIRRDDGPGGIHSQLHIPKVQPSDKGNYTCSAKNITPYTVRVYVTLGKIQIIKYITILHMSLCMYPNDNENHS